MTTIPKRPGRPLTAGEPLDARVMAQLTPTERDRLTAAADQANMTVSAYLRSLIIRDLETAK